ncbi:hypothetical protein M413DRAFT_26467 [Hebeloma cylindrosporum]|uniref:Uncharacterized protein n=1 Tax=Hebeloma cylindrosporum TaxID=76867 RepID=A0A0C2Y0C1_HEBCY|nr:hypothetical protein M413DRAFT_26467 [Hebeloma cylindrosporum h7]
MRGNLSRILLPRQLHHRRLFSTEVPTPKKLEGPGDDPRPPWVYVGTRLISMAVIPAVGVYSVFFYDFGDRDHAFQPIRRWAAQQVNKFFTLSPAEEKLLEQVKSSSSSTS